MNEDMALLRPQCRAFMTAAWSDNDSSKIRQIADNVARSVDPNGRFGLAELARRIPSDKEGFALTRPHYSGTPVVPRDHLTDEALEAFNRRLENALDEIEQYQMLAEANGALDPDERRELVLAEIAAMDKEANGQPIWFHDVQWRVSLSYPDMVDAIEHWMAYEALRTANQSTDHVQTLKRFRLTPRGRDRARKGTAMDVTSNVGFHVQNLAMNQYGAGSVQQVGAGNMAQVRIQIEAVQNAIEVVRTHLPDYPETEREELLEYLAAIDDEQRGEARPSRLKTFFKGVGSVIKGAGEAVSPVIKATASGAVEGAISALTNG